MYSHAIALREELRRQQQLREEDEARALYAMAAPPTTTPALQQTARAKAPSPLGKRRADAPKTEAHFEHLNPPIATTALLDQQAAPLLPQRAGLVEIP